MNAEIFISTPLGEMVALASENGLCLLEFVGQEHLERELAAVYAARKGQFNRQFAYQLENELVQYFSGSLKQFSLQLDTIGTDFQKSVWNALLHIPYGKTWTYKQQAQFLQHENAVRAVAAANGQNKISIIIPCHRVIGSNGKLTGYAGGLSRKQFLLDLENPQQKIPNI